MLCVSHVYITYYLYSQLQCAIYRLYTIHCVCVCMQHCMLHNLLPFSAFIPCIPPKKMPTHLFANFGLIIDNPDAVINHYQFYC